MKKYDQWIPIWQDTFLNRNIYTRKNLVPIFSSDSKVIHPTWKNVFCLWNNREQCETIDLLYAYYCASDE